MMPIEPVRRVDMLMDKLAAAPFGEPEFAEVETAMLTLPPSKSPFVLERLELTGDPAVAGALCRALAFLAPDSPDTLEAILTRIPRWPEHVAQAAAELENPAAVPVLLSTFDALEVTMDAPPYEACHALRLTLMRLGTSLNTAQERKYNMVLALEKRRAMDIMHALRAMQG